MNSMDKRKVEQVRGMNTAALQRIVDHLAGPEALPRTPERPLGGMVHLSGIGQIPVGMLRAELDRRSSEAS